MSAAKVIATYPKARRHRDTSGRRWHVRYSLAYDRATSEWTGHYRGRRRAKLAIWWHRHIASWGGVAVLIDTRPRP